MASNFEDNKVMLIRQSTGQDGSDSRDIRTEKTKMCPILCHTLLLWTRERVCAPSTKSYSGLYHY